MKLPMRQVVYPSGLRVLAERDGRSPVVGVFLVVGAGSSSDPPGKEGLAHYVEHLTFRSRPFGKSNVARLLERAGAGRANAFTGFDATVYYEIGPASALPELLRVEGARMLAPVVQVTPETLAAELGVVRSELRQRNETGFAGEVLSALQGQLFPASHPYSRPVIGTHAALAGITAEDAAAFIKAHYRPDNMTLVVVGDVDLAGMDATFAHALPPELVSAAPAAAKRPPRLPVRAPEPPPPPPAASPIPRREASVATPEIWIGWSLPRAFDTDAYLVHFVEHATEEALSGASRTDEDIVSVSTRLVGGKDASMLLCRVVLQGGLHPERSMEHVVDRLHHAWGMAASAEDVQVGEVAFGARKTSAIVDMLEELENPLTRGIARALRTHFTEDPTVYSRALRSVAELDWTRAGAYAARYLTRERARAVVFKPHAGGPLPDALPVGADALDDDALPPILVDAGRLRSAFSQPAVRRYRRLTLPNGMRVILGARPGVPSASAHLLLHGGFTATSDVAAAGVAMLLARPNETGHGEASQFGAKLGKTPERDHVAYVMTGAAGNIGIMLAVLAERVQSMEVDSGSWEPFERDRLPYLRASEQKPEIASEREFWAALLPGHPYGHPLTAREIGESGTSAAQRWLDATHVPRNAVLSVVGEIDVARVEQIVVDQFGGWSDDGPEAPPPAPPSAGTGAAAPPRLVVTARPAATQVQLRYGCLLPPSLQSAVDARHDLSAELLQERLRRTLRERLGVTYGIQVGAGVHRGGTAYLELEGAVERDRLGVALTTLRDALRDLAAAPIEPAHLDWAKLRLVRGRSLGNVTNRALAAQLVARVNLGWGAPSLDDYPDEVAAVTPAQIRDEFARCLGGRPTLALIGDDAAARRAFAEVWP